jgi:hypothetical protein
MPLSGFVFDQRYHLKRMYFDISGNRVDVKTVIQEAR